MRQDGRRPDQLRPLKITKGFIPTAEGSVLIEMGRTRVICTASIEERVPQFLKDSGKGWVTAEYSMLPRSTSVRTAREAVQGRQSGRTLEIQRLIGRSLRSVMNTEVMGERTLWLDCDVIEADGGTRTASITGAFMAMADAVKYGIDRGLFTKNPIIDLVAAISVGVVDGAPALDLNYGEDYGADVDMNVVMTGSGRIVEVQGTAERTPFDRKALDNLLDLASKGLSELFERQRAELGALVIK